MAITDNKCHFMTTKFWCNFNERNIYFFVLYIQKARKYELYNSLEKMVYEDVIPTANNFLHNMFALLINSTILILINGVVFCYNLSGTTDSQCYFLTAKLSNVTLLVGRKETECFVLYTQKQDKYWTTQCHNSQPKMNNEEVTQTSANFTVPKLFALFINSKINSYTQMK